MRSCCRCRKIRCATVKLWQGGFCLFLCREEGLKKFYVPRKTVPNFRQFDVVRKRKMGRVRECVCRDRA